MSNPFEHYATNANDRAEGVPRHGDDLAAATESDPVSVYRNERWIPTAQEVSAAQAQLDKLGIGSLTLNMDDAISTPNAVPEVQYVDSQLVKDMKARLTFAESQQQRSYQFVEKNQNGSLVLGPYKLDGESIVSWISNVTPDELSAMANMSDGVKSSIRAISGLSLLAQGYKQGLSPDRARQQFADVVSDPAVQNFMLALRAMQSGTDQMTGDQLASIITPDLQELIVGDTIRAAGQMSAEQMHAISTEQTNASQAASADASKPSSDAKILPGPLHKVDVIS